MADKNTDKKTDKKLDKETELNMTLKTVQFMGIVSMILSMMVMKLTSYFEVGVVLLIVSLILLSYEKYWVLIL
jgi:hypothetical protein